MATAKKAPKAKKMDPKLVAGTQPHEVKYAAKKAGATSAEVRTAVKKVGNSRSKVEGELKKGKS